MKALSNTVSKAMVFCLCLLEPFAPLRAQNQPTFRQDRILVKPLVGNLDALHQQLSTTVLRRYPNIGNIQVVQLPAGLSVAQAIARFQSSGEVWYAEPDYIGQAAVTIPNDPKYADGTLWGLNNTGQNGGTADADIDAPEGWDKRTAANNVIVAVIDSGVRYTHEDLAANMWTNPGEIAGDNIDNDGNGYTNDVHGINAITGTGDPNDDSGHGTHVAGIIGAVGNNSTGVVGVAWGVKIMALKWLDSTGSGSTSDAIRCIDYATKMRAQVINASWTVTFSQSLREAIAAARNQGIILVAAAANFSTDNDAQPSYPYPAKYDLDNIISVAATTRTDGLASYSDWGLVSVHLGAPGGEPGSSTNHSTWTDGVYSTYNLSDSDYQYDAGTSMAAPHVSGTLALMRAYFTVESYVQVKNRLLSSTDPLPSLSGLTQTGGRLNLNGALNTTFWRPRNNDFANAFTIARPSTVSSITYVANNVDATKETGEPNHAGNAGGKSVWWNWTAPDNNSVTFTTKGSGFDTLLAVYTGASVSSLTAVASDDNSCQCSASQLTFTPSSGTTYHVAVDGYNGAQGTIKLNLQTDSSAQPTSLQFTLSTVQRLSGQFSVTVTGPASAVVTLDTSSDLSTWTPGYASFTLSGSGSFPYTDTTATPFVRFYRASISSSGQPSCNVVGYVDRTMPSGMQSMHCNPLNASDNHINAVLPSMSVGDTLNKWDDATQQFISNSFLGSGWSDPSMILAPGEGFIISVGTTLTHSFVGEVAQGHGVNSVPNLQSIRSSAVAQAGRLVTDLGFPVINGDTVTRLINGSYTTYTYSNGTWSPSEPSLSVGESFWSNKNVGFWWHRNFLVWP